MNETTKTQKAANMMNSSLSFPPQNMMDFIAPYREMYNGIKTGFVEFHIDLFPIPYKMTVIILHSRQEVSACYGLNQYGCQDFLCLYCQPAHANRFVNDISLSVRHTHRNMCKHIHNQYTIYAYAYTNI